MPSIGVDVGTRTVTMGSIVRKQAVSLSGDAKFFGNLTIEHGDLRLLSGKVSLRDMNFGQVRNVAARSLEPRINILEFCLRAWLIIT